MICVVLVLILIELDIFFECFLDFLEEIFVDYNDFV